MSGQIRVLHVDDDPDFAALTATYLEREDDRLSVQTAHSAAEGRELIAEEPPDCVVSDYDMPRTNGIEFLRAVREDHPELPFILFTGKGSEEVASDAVSAGVTDYLQKRHGSEQYELLANRVVNAVEQARAQQRAEEYQRVSTVVREINRTLAQATDHETVRNRVCEILADADPYVLAWMGTVGGDDRIEPQAAAGSGAEYLEEITVTVDDSPTGRGPGGTAVREDRIAVSQDIEDDASFAPWRDAAREFDFQAVAAMPLTYSDTQYGVVAVYADRAGAFDERERELLAELSDTIAHALHRIDVQRQYESQYQELFEDAPVMFAITREESGEPVIEDCNRLFAETLGYDTGELTGSRLAELYDDTSADALLGGGYDRALSGDFVREKRDLLTRDGEVVTTLLRAVPRRDTDGAVVGTHALFVDVSDRTRLEQLESLRERMSFALEATESVLYERNLDEGTITRHGPFERLYDVPAEEVRTDAAFEERCVHPDDRDQFWDELDLTSFEADSETRRSEFRTHPDHGEVRWIESVAYLIGGGERPRRIIGLDTNVTERTERERELRERSEEIGHQNERLEEFVSVVSHDLRNPLTVAGGKVELAQTECDSPHLDGALDAIDRCQALIDDLLALARHGDDVDDTDWVSLSEVVTQCWQTIPTAGATLRCETDRRIRADRSRLKQLLENLIGNAVEHGSTSPRSQAREDAVEHGDSAVTVTVGVTEDGFYVADDGPGIGAADRERVFDAGYSTAADGTGFGLRIVERIADAHGWAVAVADAEGGGARFEISGVTVE